MNWQRYVSDNFESLSGTHAQDDDVARIASVLEKVMADLSLARSGRQDTFDLPIDGFDHYLNSFAASRSGGTND
jgi:hypothetical protein